MEPKTTSQKQIMANRKNAQIGGVKSEEGKAVSKYNAVTHGVLRQSVTKYEKGMYQDMLLIYLKNCVQ